MEIFTELVKIKEKYLPNLIFEALNVYRPDCGGFTNFIHSLVSLSCYRLANYQLANGIWELQTSPLEWLGGPTLKSP